MTEGLTRFASVTGRFFLSAIFLSAGVMKLMDWQHTADYMTSKGMPLIPVLLPAAAAVEITGGLMLLLGWRARLGALALLLFLIPTTLIFHNFWMHTGAEQQNQMQHFMKNIAIMGGLLMVLALGPGLCAFDVSAGRTDPVLSDRR